MNPTTNQPDHNPTNSRRASFFRLALDHGYSRETGVGSDEVGDQKLQRFLLRL